MVQLYGRSADEFFVNTFTEGTQSRPLMARLASGGFVLVWADQVGDLFFTITGLKAQIYDAAGAKVGGEILVNSSDATWWPDGVAALPNGGFIVTYNTGEVTAQMFDSAGVKTGGEIVLTAPDPFLPAGRQWNVNSDVAVLPSGAIIVTWDKQVGYRSGPEVDVFAQALTPEGAKSGAAFRVNQFANGHQQASTVTALASGGYVVIWDDDLEYEGGLRGQIHDAGGVPVGNSFRVTTRVEGEQEAVAVTALQGGGFVAIWEDYSYDEEDRSIRGQIFTDAGVKVGPEFLVNTGNEWNQYAPAVDDLPGGGFVVTWYDDSLGVGDGSEGAIMAQVFDAAGAKVGTQFLVNRLTGGDQNMPAVAGLASGGFVVAWASDIGSNDIKAQLFAPFAGTPTDIALSPGAVLETSMANLAAATLSHNGAVNDAPTFTLVADSTGGGFRIEGNRLVVADNRRLDHETAPMASLTIRVTDSNGNSYEEALSVPIADSVVEDRYSAGADFTASGATASRHMQAAIGALASGGYVMAWVDSDLGGSNATVRAQMFGPAGAKVGGELAVGPALAQLPAAAGLLSGGFVIVWHDWQTTGGDSELSGIRGQRFDSAGARVGEEFVVNTIVAGGQSEPTVAALASGGFIVAWTDKSNSTADDFGDGDVRAQMYDASGAKLGGELLVNSTTYSVQSGPAVAALPGGGFVVTWMDRGHDAVAAQRFDSAGNKAGGEIRLPAGSDPAIASLESGGFVISWTDNQDWSGPTSIQAQIFGADGGRLGEPFLVETETRGTQTASSISALLSGGFVVSWVDSPRGPGEMDNVRARMFDAAGAPTGEEFTVPAGAAGGQYSPVSTILSSGSFVVGWTEFGTASAIEGRLFSLIQAGNSGDDTLVGDDDANVIDGGAGDDQLYGKGGNDDIRGGDGNDLLHAGSGEDSATGGAGNDGILFGAALSAGDLVDGGEGTRDQLGLQGNYGTFGAGATAFTLGVAHLVNVEMLVLLSGSDGRFGDTAGNAYSYNIATVDANVASGQQLVVNFNTLLVGENVTFDGSAETNGSFMTYGGLGTDILTGGQQSDSFYFGADGRFGSGDRVDGQGGTLDQLGLQGDYSGARGVSFAANSLTGIEMLVLLSAGDNRFGGGSGDGFSYDIVLNDSNVADGARMFISANTLRSDGTLDETLDFDGSAEKDGFFTVYAGSGADTIVGGERADEIWGRGGVDLITGGLGADILRGGDGNDVFDYNDVTESTAASRDSILDFASGSDRIDLSGIDANTHADGDQAFTWIGTNAFTGSGAASAGQLRAYEDGANWIIQGDTDGDGIADLVIQIPIGALDQADFLP